MKRFSLMILLVYSIIDDYTIFADHIEIINPSKHSNAIAIAIEKKLKVGVKQLDMVMGHRPNNRVYETDDKTLLFVKKDTEIGADKKYHGEFEGLKVLNAANKIAVPKPIAVGHTEKNDEQFIVIEYKKMTALYNASFMDLGHHLADLHMCNWHGTCGNQIPIKRFGFHVDTYGGFISRNNTWTNDWITFMIENRFNQQLELMKSNSIKSLIKTKVLTIFWPELKPLIPKLFEGIDIKPSLLHGDLWSGNIGRWNAQPIIFDPATFYGHYEYDIASTTLFGGYTNAFYDAYFEKIPKVDGFEDRLQFYRLFHFLSHWNQYDGSDELHINFTFEHLLKVLRE